MEADFWHRRWQKNEIGFHEQEGSQLLRAYIEKLSLPAGTRVFVPLCGKTRDIAWLLSKGFSVVGIELNTKAVDQLFEELEVKAEHSKTDGFELRSALFADGLSLDVFVGDIFALRPQLLGNVDAVFDRAALVALPKEMRKKYAERILFITNSCRQLLICFEYAEGLLEGPPHSVDAEEVNILYGNKMNIKQVYRDKIEGGFREQSDVSDAVYLLHSK